MISGIDYAKSSENPSLRYATILDCDHIVLTGRRTTLVPGRETDYVRIHAAIPPAVEAALRSNGVLRWHIWRDGRFLFHAIETSNGYENMAAAMEQLGPIDAEWDALILSLLESEPASDVILPLVWSME